ncbi:MAG: restriction endonuclease subunit S, partial [Treponema sp.]|nr:restriction endonuclease subunit S [Treponema sp.]
IIDLFDLSLPKGDLQIKKVKDGEIPLITPSNNNNGWLKRISKESKSTLYKGKSLTVDMFGNAYYQDEDFFVTAHGHVNVLIPKISMNQYIGMFLATSIRTMFLDKYGFDEMCTQKVLKTEKIKLPVTSDNQPDWQYMEKYMENIMKKSEKSISFFKI